MAKTLFWLQGGGCGGDSMAFLGVESPEMIEFLRLGDVEVLWHPSLSQLPLVQFWELVESISRGDRPLDFFILEGAVIRGPGGTGLYDSFNGGPKKDLILRLSTRAKHVIALGTCAGFGGIGADGDVGAIGLQFAKRNFGGFLGSDFRSLNGNPVINLPGCPCPGDVLISTLATLIHNMPLELGDHNAPSHWYGMLVHQGCSRNEYHEYQVEEDDFGRPGCLFFHMGCRGPLTHGPCNKTLWNRRSSKTRVGVPCFGCTDPDFPQPYPFFQTRNIADIPLELPEGVDRAHYLAYKGMAAEAAPERLKRRQTRV